MKIDKKEETNRLEKVKNTTVKNLNIMLKKELVFHHQDKSTGVIQWVSLLNLEKNLTKFLYVVLTAIPKKWEGLTHNLVPDQTLTFLHDSLLKLKIMVFTTLIPQIYIKKRN